MVPTLLVIGRFGSAVDVFEQHVGNGPTLSGGLVELWTVDQTAVATQRVFGREQVGQQGFARGIGPVDGHYRRRGQTQRTFECEGIFGPAGIGVMKRQEGFLHKALASLIWGVVSGCAPAPERCLTKAFHERGPSDTSVGRLDSR